MSSPDKENPKTPFRKKNRKPISPETVRCHKPYSPLKGMQSQNEN